METRQATASQALQASSAVTGGAGHRHNTLSLYPHASPAASSVGRQRGDSPQLSPNPPFMPVVAHTGSEMGESETAATAHFLFSTPVGEAKDGGVQGGGLAAALSPVTPGMLSVNKNW